MLVGTVNYRRLNSQCLAGGAKLNLRARRIKTTVFVVCVMSASTLVTPNCAAQTASPMPERQIDLRALNFEQPKIPNYKNSEIFANLSLLFQDVHAHVEFVTESELVVYSSDVVDERVQARNGQSPSPEPTHRMQALFLDADNGTLVSHEIWQTRRRRFFNTGTDTQARIIPVRSGFLVHANNTLALYAADLHKKREMALDDSLEYAAIVAPGGDVFFLEHDTPGVVTSAGGVSMVQNVDRGLLTAHGEWRSSETFDKLGSIDLFPGGADSVSKDAFAGRWYRCIVVQRVDSIRTPLCCDDPCTYGQPVFLDNDEVVSFFRSGFQVLSTKGKVLWGRQSRDWKNWKNFILSDDVRSLDGSRFAGLFYADRKVEIDGTEIPKKWFGVLVYDRSKRAKVFSALLKPENAPAPAIALSPSGDRLAILSGTTLFLYRMPETSTPD
jgi:hypothetical protein